MITEMLDQTKLHRTSDAPENETSRSKLDSESIPSKSMTGTRSIVKLYTQNADTMRTLLRGNRR